MKTVGVTELQRQFRSIFEEVVVGNVPCLLPRSSKPEAVLVSYEEFMRLQEHDFARRFDELVQRMTEKNARYTEAEVMNEVKVAIQEVASSTENDAGRCRHQCAGFCRICILNPREFFQPCTSNLIS